MTYHTVEDFLIGPLVVHFEDDEPTDGIRKVLHEDYDDTPQEQLTAAVEFLKRNIVTKTSFPAPKKIAEAIKSVKFAPKASAGNFGHVTADNFTQLQAEYAAMNKSRIKVIEKGGIEWDWWQDYLRNHIGNSYIADLMNQYTRWGVVARHPAEFDPSFSS